ncbi:MAG: hypothetical protein JXR03_18345 [Cyclobacteriaceae bacterium]
MEYLHEYYGSRMITVTVVLLLSVLLIPTKLIPFLKGRYGSKHWYVKIMDALTSRTSVLIVITGAHFLINNYLWKLEKPQYDFDGIWTGTTTYEKVLMGNEPDTLPFTSEHELKIVQSCLDFELAPTDGEDYVNWGSEAANLSDRNTIKYAYWVRYSDLSKFPERAKGYEVLKVLSRDSRGRPIELSGEFFHCAQGQTPVYNGRVIFTRNTN